MNGPQTPTLNGKTLFLHSPSPLGGLSPSHASWCVTIFVEPPALMWDLLCWSTPKTHPGGLTSIIVPGGLGHRHRWDSSELRPIPYFVWQLLPDKRTHITGCEYLRETEEICRVVTTLNKDNYLNERLSRVTCEANPSGGWRMACNRLKLEGFCAEPSWDLPGKEEEKCSAVVRAALGRPILPPSRDRWACPSVWKWGSDPCGQIQGKPSPWQQKAYVGFQTILRLKKKQNTTYWMLSII